MGRKVFMSILGTGLYEPSKYFFDSRNDAIESRFIQEATVCHYCSNWEANDKIIIFTTEAAFKNNFDENITSRYDHKKGEDVEYYGLEKILKNLCLKCKHEAVFILDGKNEEEIWSVFNTIYQKIEDKDEIYFDLTHSFRYLPMLLLILLNYAKYLKQVEIKSITYGNYEASKELQGFSPVMQLLPLIQLQDWTIAAHNFQYFGETKLLSRLCQSELKEILRQAKGTNQTASNTNYIAKHLPDFVENIKTCRGKNIYNGSLATSLADKFNQLENTSIEAFNPIFKRLKYEIQKFAHSDDIKNGLKAVDWCIEKGLIQQGYTLLEETIISLVAESENIDLYDKKIRDIISSAAKILNDGLLDEEQWKGECALEENKLLTHKLLKNPILNNTCKQFSQIRDLRNDINHAGITQQTKAHLLAKNLKESFDSIKRSMDIADL